MKILFFILIAVTTYAQHITFVDSLNSDNLSVIRKLRSNYSLVHITVENIGSAPCTLNVKTGREIYNYNGIAYDTVWSYVPLQDTSFNKIISKDIIIPIAASTVFTVMKFNPWWLQYTINSSPDVAVRIITEGNK